MPAGTVHFLLTAARRELTGRQLQERVQLRRARAIELREMLQLTERELAKDEEVMWRQIRREIWHRRYEL